MKSFNIMPWILLFLTGCADMQGLDPDLLPYHYKPRRNVFFFSKNPTRDQESISKCLNGMARRCIDVAAGFMQQENKPAVFKFFEIACNLDYGKGCYGAGRMKLDENQRVSAGDFFEKGCRYKYGPACFALAELKYSKSQKKEDMYKLYGMACDMKGDYGCVRLGEVFYDEGNLGLAQFYFHRSCSLKNELGCYNAGHTFYTEKKLFKALEMLRLSCKYGQGTGCYQMARYYGYIKDEEKIFFFLNEAFKHDYDNWERVEFDENFDFLRKRQAFRDLIDSFLLKKREKKVSQESSHQAQKAKEELDLVY